MDLPSFAIVAVHHAGCDDNVFISALDEQGIARKFTAAVKTTWVVSTVRKSYSVLFLQLQKTMYMPATASKPKKLNLFVILTLFMID